MTSAQRAKGGGFMATKSILKTIHIKKSRSVASLVDALEHAKGKQAKEVTMSRTYSTASREEIKKMFGESNDGI